MKLFKRKAKPLNCTVLKSYRYEAYGRVHYSGGWSGYFETRIDGIRYRSERVSGFKALTDDYGNFVIDAILDRVRIRKNPEKYKKDLAQCHYGGSRFVYPNGNVEQWTS